MSETPRYILCPYCGHPQSVADQCSACGGLFEPLSRKATQISMGPWFIRDRNSPFRPGCSFEILKKQIDAGRVKGNTVLRGPTTHQFWSVARNTPGVSHLLGYCHDCNASVQPTDPQCPKCSANFNIPETRNQLGLLYPNEAAVAKAQSSLDREINKRFGDGKSDNSSTSSSSTSKAKSSRPLSDDEPQTRAPVQGGIDLLDQVLNTPGNKSSSSSSKLRSGSQADGASAKPTSLDFTPSVNAPDDGVTRQSGTQANAAAAGAHAEAHPTAAVPSSSGSNHLLIWLLVVSNVVVVGLLAAAVFLLKQPAN